MAVNGGAQGDFNAHEKTYSGFISLFKFGTVAAMVIAAIVVLVIAS